MSIHHRVLGQPGRDNAVAVTVDSGQRQSSILFDCGEGCLSNLSVSEIRGFDHVCFSHFHMDHVAGFDGFFRCTYNRPSDSPMKVWGPPGTIDVMHHRFRGFWWNLHAKQPGRWQVHEIGEDGVEVAEFRTREAFKIRHDLRAGKTVDQVWNDPDYSVIPIMLEHHGPVMGYRIDEKPVWNVDPEKLQACGLRPGPWIDLMKAGASKMIEVEGKSMETQALRDELLVESEGESFAYLTDFALTEESMPKIAAWLAGCDVVVCEAQYRHADLELAQKNCHATTRLVGNLAADANVEDLVLFHLSERYREPEWREMLEEVRDVFPKARFPAEWKF